MKSERLELIATVTEQSSDPRGQITISEDDVRRVVRDDAEPQFVTVAVKTGRSKNKRRWTTAIFYKIAEQIRKNQPNGYLGHIKEQDDGYAFPKPQTIWLGATVVPDGGEATLYVKGYNLPGAEIRDYVLRGAADSTSWRGDAMLRPENGGYEVTDFMLESMDWSRKGNAGMGARVVSITSEMEEGVDPKEIAALSLDELRQHNPLLVEKIEREAKSEAETKVTEMQTKVDDAEKDKKLLTEIREKLGLDESGNILEAVGVLTAKVSDGTKAAAKAIVEDVFRAKVKDDRARGIIQRLVTVKEMQEDEDEEKFKKRVEEEVDEALEKDENVKAVVGEMKGARQEGGRTIPAGGVSEMDRSKGQGSKDGNEENEFFVREKIKPR